MILHSNYRGNTQKYAIMKKVFFQDMLNIFVCAKVEGPPPWYYGTLSHLKDQLYIYTYMYTYLLDTSPYPELLV